MSAESAGRDHLRLLLSSLPERQALNYAAARPRGLDLVLSIAVVMPEAVSTALDNVIRGRAVVLDEIAARQSDSRQSTAATDARAALRAAQRRLANLVVRGPGALSPDGNSRVLEDARRQSEAAEESLVEASASYRAERIRAQFGLEQVARALEPGSALVSFVQYNRRSPAVKPTGGLSARAVRSYLAFLTRPGQPPVAISLGSGSAIDNLITRWREDIVAEVLSPITQQSGEPGLSSRTSGSALRRATWDPLLSHLAGVERVFIVPDGQLGLVPFAALPSGRRSYLLESAAAIHYLSAERDLPRPWSGAGTTTEGLLAVGGPAFGARQRQVGPASVGIVGSNPGGTLCGLQSLTFPPLNGTLQEVNDVTRVWNAAAGAEARPPQLLTGTTATEASFKREAQRNRVLHVATHGFFLDDTCAITSVTGTRGVGGLAKVGGKTPATNPLRLSGLALAGANRRDQARPDEDDGILTAEEVASLDLQGVEWAVLSACDTGVGEIKAGEGVFGLRRAFQVAGARTVIMSLWSVDDQATRAWMRALYEGRFQKRLSTADAVHQASLSVLRDRRARGQSTHPFFWAAFVAAGDWR